MWANGKYCLNFYMSFSQMEHNDGEAILTALRFKTFEKMKKRL